ncbi:MULTISPECIES: hypothetical protein [Streptomyces]
MTFGTRVACFIHYDLGRTHIAAGLAATAALLALGRHLSFEPRRGTK